eukprot:TRINITY_DN699_c0_g1_i2.p1 TRINITY_DN699_c0_g1~~TRINITY_DN699_c0_g1_i2.p1  ORF type:complete len:152 (-),score=30.58 TRINITY_DN699_c0_g1_i2:55-510(-)
MSECRRLIALYKALAHEVPDLKKFMEAHKLDCSAGYNRIILGPPAVMSEEIGKSAGVFVAQAVQFFITAMDSVRLKQTSIDNLHPFIAEILENLEKVPGLDASFDGKQRMKQWMVTLNSMKASDELSEDQSRQLLFDLECSYNAFVKALKK